MGRAKFDNTEQVAQRDREWAANGGQEKMVNSNGASEGGKLLPGSVAPDWGGSQYGKEGDTSAYDRDVERDRRMGEESNRRAAPVLDQTQANESRGMQIGALGLLRAQADGSAASSAQILSQRANQNAAMQAGASGLGKHPGANLAAFNHAAPAVGTAALASNAQNAQMRANEIARSQTQYAGGAQQAQGQDLQAATMNAQLEAQQRALNEKRQQEFERRGWNVRNQESMGEDRYKRNTDAALNQNEANNLAQQARDSAHAKEQEGMYEKGISAIAMGSDERMKTDAHPIVGSLAHLMRRR